MDLSEQSSSTSFVTRLSSDSCITQFRCQHPHRGGPSRSAERASVVIDVSNSRSFEDAAALKFFETSTRNLLAYEVAAGVGHHIALSVVGLERLPEYGYFRAKIVQEDLIKGSSIPYSIVRATQFFEFVDTIADEATEGSQFA